MSEEAEHNENIDRWLLPNERYFVLSLTGHNCIRIAPEASSLSMFRRFYDVCSRLTWGAEVMVLARGNSKFDFSSFSPKRLSARRSYGTIETSDCSTRVWHCLRHLKVMRPCKQRDANTIRRFAYEMHLESVILRFLISRFSQSHAAPGQTAERVPQNSLLPHMLQDRWSSSDKTITKW